MITCGFIFRAHAPGAPVYRPMLILACLTGVSGLVVLSTSVVNESVSEKSSHVFGDKLSEFDGDELDRRSL